LKGEKASRSTMACRCVAWKMHRKCTRVQNIVAPLSNARLFHQSINQSINCLSLLSPRVRTTHKKYCERHTNRFETTSNVRQQRRTAKRPVVAAASRVERVESSRTSRIKSNESTRTRKNYGMCDCCYCCRPFSRFYHPTPLLTLQSCCSSLR